MLTLLTYPGSFDQPSHSPYCVKAMGLLNMSGQPWQAKYLGDPRKMPYGRLPVLKLEDGALIPDSAHIQAYLEGLGAEFWSGLSREDRAYGQGLIRMAESSLYDLLVHDRWLDDRSWPEVKQTFFAEIPGLLRGPITRSLRKKVRARMTANGIAQFPPQERLASAKRDFDALAALLSDRPYLLGDTPCAADLSVAPTLAMIANLPGATESREELRSRADLMGYIERCQDLFALPSPEK